MFGFDKVTAGYDLLKKGNAVADPAAWKKRQITTTMITALIWSGIKGAQAFAGFDIPIDEGTVDNVAIGILALVNWLFTLSTSKTVGIGEK